jgi:DNA gyrase subunit B/topoisomerase-4 subunit B
MQNNYDASNIEVLDPREAVRQRPGMYIGSTDSQGLHHLLFEIVDNSVDEYLNGFAESIQVTLKKDRRTLAVKDDGRGIPVDIEPKTKRPAVEVVFSTLHAGAKFKTNNAYKGSGGLHGVGSAVTNFLSESLSVTVWRDEKVYSLSFREGLLEEPLKEVGTYSKHSQTSTGTEVVFTPDPTIFQGVNLCSATIQEYLKAKSFINKGLRIHLYDEAKDTTHEYYSENGLEDFLELIIKEQDAKTSHKDAIRLEGSLANGEHRLDYEVVLQWTEGVQDTTLSYINAIHTKSGGTHELGVREGVVRAVKAYLDISDTKTKGLRLKPEDFREGLFCIVKIFYEGDLQFQSQNKIKLNNPEIQAPLTTVVKNTLEQYLISHSDVAEKIVQRVIMAAKARQASRAVLKPKKSLNARKITLPGKLADCESNDPSVNEIFLTEGDSASGTGKMARDRMTQAILPLRGKVLNSEDMSTKDVMKNKEIETIVEALGCGIGDSFNITKLRYHKIILLMDADSDGHHITTLLLTFFYRHLPELIEEGFVYVAKPPLYRLECGKDVYWLGSDREKEKVLAKLKGRKAKIEIYRYKGLGEMMSDTLWETTLDPDRRTLIKVSFVEEVANSCVASLMGKDAKARYDLIMQNLENVENLDF